MKYIGGFLFIVESLQYYYLYKQKDDLTLQAIPISVNYTSPNSRINLLFIQLQTVDHLKGIKDISYKFNYVVITDGTVENIMHFSFNNIDNYKNLPIGFTLIDPRSIQDMGFLN
ncbi:hypothetical protein ACTA71_010760 [Dictyostelium dimigraforme]